MSTDLDLSDIADEQDLQGFDYPKAGQYHVAIEVVDESREKSDAMRVLFHVLAGTVPNQAGKSFFERFGDPNESHKDGGKFARKRLAKLGLATGLIRPESLGQKVAVNWQDLVGRQCVVAVKEYSREGTNSSGEKQAYSGAEVDGLHLYGVRDAAVKDVPKDAEMLALEEASTPGDAAAPTAATDPATSPASAPLSSQAAYSKL